MALNTARLQADLGDLYDFMATVTDAATGKTEYITRMEALLTRFIQSGAGTGTVVTVGSATTQTSGLITLPIR